MYNTLICDTPGSLVYSHVPTPTPAEGEALLKIMRIGVCGTDIHAFHGTQPYFNYPRRLGHELAAAWIGGTKPPNAPHIQEGDPVTIIPYKHCGTCIACRNELFNCCSAIQVVGVHADGGMTEFLTIPAELVLDGTGLSWNELALIEPLAIGAHALRRAAVKEKEFVLVMGAGPIGLGLMELAQLKGAQVIAMDVNSDRLAFCQNVLKVPYAIHAQTQNPTELLQVITQGDFPTVVIDATGNAQAMEQGFEFLAHGGRYVLVGLQKGNLQFSHPSFHKRETTLMSSRNATREDFDWVMSCFRNKLVKAENYITHEIPFLDAAAAFPNFSDPASRTIKAIIYGPGCS